MKILWLGYEDRVVERNKWGLNEFLILNRKNFSMDKALSFDPDIVVEREFNDGFSIFTDEMLYLKEKKPRITRAVWLIDTHISKARHLKYAPLFDVVFLAISSYVDEFKKTLGNSRVYHLPLCYPKTYLPPNMIDKKDKVVFVGRWNSQWFPERTEMIKRLSKYEWFKAETNYEDYYKILSSSKYVINRSIRQDLNYRVFEALGCGAEVITNDVPDIHNIGGLSSKLHLFTTIDEAEEIAKGLIEGKIKKKSDDIDNRRFISKNHLLSVRVDQMLSMIVDGQQFDYKL